MYFPANFGLANFAFEKLGLRLALCSGLSLVCLCLFIRSLINHSFILAMLGGLPYGLAQPLIMNSNTELASNWFSASEVI